MCCVCLHDYHLTLNDLQGHVLRSVSELFLSDEAIEQLHDFEEECLDAYFHEGEQKQLSSIDERIRLTTDRSELLVQLTGPSLCSLLGATFFVYFLYFRLTFVTILELMTRCAVQLSLAVPPG